MCRLRRHESGGLRYIWYGCMEGNTKIGSLERLMIAAARAASRAFCVLRCQSLSSTSGCKFHFSL